MADKQDAMRLKQPTNTKSLTVREAYDMHKLVSKDENRLHYISGYMKGYHDATESRTNRFDDYFDREDASAGNDLAATDNQNQVEPLKSAPTTPNQEPK